MNKSDNCLELFTLFIVFSLLLSAPSAHAAWTFYGHPGKTGEVQKGSVFADYDAVLLGDVDIVTGNKAVVKSGTKAVWAFKPPASIPVSRYNSLKFVVNGYDDTVPNCDIQLYDFAADRFYLTNKDIFDYTEQGDTYTSSSNFSRFFATKNTYLVGGLAGNIINKGDIPVLVHCALGEQATISYVEVELGINDTSPPTTPSITIDNNKTCTNASTVPITMSAKDDVGIVGYYLSDSPMSPTLENPNWQFVTPATSFSTTSNKTFTNGEKKYTWYAFFRDVGGNVPAGDYVSKSIVYDKTPPAAGTFIVPPQPTYAYNQSCSPQAAVKLSWSGFTDANDATCGPVTYKVVYSTSNDLAVGCTNGTPIFTGTGTSKTHSPGASGTYYYRLCATDGAGNTTTSDTKQVTLDLTPPAAGKMKIADDSPYAASRETWLRVDDTGNEGIVGYITKETAPVGTPTPPAAPAMNDPQWQSISSALTNTVLSYDMTTAKDGQKYVYIWYRDAACNLSSLPGYDGIKLDTAAPANGTLTATPEDSAVTLSWNPMTDPTSGIDQPLLVYDTTGFPAASCTNGTPLPAVSGITHTGLTNSTTYYFRLCARDKAGNTATGTTASATPSVAGCGTSNGGVFASAPATSLCAAGNTASTVTTTASGWSWTCGTASGTPAPCFATQSFTIITTGSGVNGSVDCTTPVSSGANAICTITPADGYQLATFIDNGVDQKASVNNNRYTVSAVAANHTIAVTFAATSPATPPDAPTLALLPASDSGVKGDLTTKDVTPAIRVSLNGSGAAAPLAGDVVRVFVDGTQQVGTRTLSGADIAAGYADIAVSTLGSDGVKGLTATVTNAQGAASPPSPPLVITLDTTAPLLVTATVAGRALVLTYDEALSSVRPAVASFTVNKNGNTAVGVSAVAVNPIDKTVTLTLASALASADTATVSYAATTNKVQDAAANVATNLTDTAVTNLTLDTSPPAAPTLTLLPASDSGVKGDRITKDGTPSLRVALNGSGAAAPVAGDVVKVMLGGTKRVAMKTLVAADITAHSVTVTTSSLGAAGAKSLTATVTSAAQQTSPASAPLIITIDRTPPQVTLDSKPPNPTSSTSAEFAFSANEPGATFKCWLDSGLFSTCVSPKGYPGLSAGSHTFQVRATDAAGWTSPVATHTWRINNGGAPPPAAVCPLNDTGIDWYGSGSENFLTTAPPGFEGQDGDYGRDRLALDGVLIKQGNGNAGFDFTKLDANGNDLPALAASWSCVRDNHTRLIWEEKSEDGGLRDQSWTYSWYNSDPATNGGAVGSLDPASGSGWCGGHLAHCNTETYVAAVNRAGLCGASDWRLPSDQELQSIVDYGRVETSIDTAYFPHMPQWSGFWSSSPDAGSSDLAWFVYFGVGYVYNDYRSSYYSVRLVRGGQ